MKLILMEFFEALTSMTLIDECDWYMVCQFAEKWKLSVADALLDLNFVDETTLAKALAKAKGFSYISGMHLHGDFSEMELEELDDLMTAGALPLINGQHAICNPYDDIHGALGHKFCSREMVISEKSIIFEKLREVSMSGWLEEDDELY